MFVADGSVIECTLVSRANICVVGGVLLGGSVDFAKKKEYCRGRRPSNYLVESRVELPEYTLPLDTNFHPCGISTWDPPFGTVSEVVRHPNKTDMAKNRGMASTRG